MVLLHILIVPQLARSVLPVWTTNCAAFFQIVINSISSPDSSTYWFTFFKTLMLYPQHNHLFEVTTTPSVFVHFFFVKRGKSTKDFSKCINIFKISNTKSCFSNAKSWAFFIFTVEISSIAPVIWLVFLIDQIFLFISLAFAILF